MIGRTHVIGRAYVIDDWNDVVEIHGMRRSHVVSGIYRVNRVNGRVNCRSHAVGVVDDHELRPLEDDALVWPATTRFTATPERRFWQEHRAINEHGAGQ